MASNAKMPGTEVPVSERTEARGADAGPRLDDQEHLAVSEFTAAFAAAPSPFGDDLIFPLPVEQLTYIPTATP